MCGPGNSLGKRNAFEIIFLGLSYSDDSGPFPGTAQMSLFCTAVSWAAGLGASGRCGRVEFEEPSEGADLGTVFGIAAAPPLVIDSAPDLVFTQGRLGDHDGYSPIHSWPALYRELRPAKGVRTGLLRGTIGLELINTEPEMGRAIPASKKRSVKGGALKKGWLKKVG